MQSVENEWMCEIKSQIILMKNEIENFNENYTKWKHLIGKKEKQNKNKQHSKLMSIVLYKSINIWLYSNQFDVKYIWI